MSQRKAVTKKMAIRYRRALSRYIRLDWVSGIGARILVDAFRALAVANDDYERGRTVDKLQHSSAAFAILEEVRALADFDDTPSRTASGPSATLLRRWVDETSGLLLMIEGRWSEAELAFERALHYASSHPRGQVKVSLGRELNRYLRSVAEGNDAESAIEETARLADDPRAADESDLRRTAKANLARMRQGRVDLDVYAVL